MLFIPQPIKLNTNHCWRHPWFANAILQCVHSGVSCDYSNFHEIFNGLYNGYTITCIEHAYTRPLSESAVQQIIDDTVLHSNSYIVEIERQNGQLLVWVLHVWQTFTLSSFSLRELTH